LFFLGPMEHINCSSLHLPAIVMVDGGEHYFVSTRPSVSWIFGPKITNQLFSLGATNSLV